MICIKIADLPIGIENKFRHIEHIAKDYITSEDPIFTVSAARHEIEEEGKNGTIMFSDGYLESIVVYRKIAEILPEYGAFVFHSAVINYCGNAYAFTAKSGVGKTTHTGLWLREFPNEAKYLNGDKPIVRLKDGVFTAYGTPWRGKEGFGENVSAPLRSIVLLERGEKNETFLPDPSVSAIKLMKQIYMPKDPLTARKTMQLASKMLLSVKFIGLKCNMDPEAAHVAKRALTEE